MNDDRRRGEVPFPAGAPKQLSDDLRSMQGKLQDMVEMLRRDRASRLGDGAGNRGAPEPVRRPATVDPRPPAPGPLDGSAGAPPDGSDLLRERLAELEQDHRHASEASARIEAQMTEQCSQLVMLERLHGTVDHAEVLQALQEIVVNLVGCEELALFTAAEGGRELRPELSLGVDAAMLGPVQAGSGPIGRAVTERRSWTVADGPVPPDCAGLTACVPLQAGGQVVGVLVLWRLLGHKPALTDGDRRLLDRIGIHAGTALHLTRLAGQPGGAAPGQAGRP